MENPEKREILGIASWTCAGLGGRLGETLLGILWGRGDGDGEEKRGVDDGPSFDR